MVGISGGGGGDGGGYNYVQDAEPGDPSEGEEWYDNGADAAFVYDGSAWIEQTVVEHGQLSGVGSGDHHSRYSDNEARSAVRVRSGKKSASVSGDEDSATIYLNDNLPWRLRVSVYSETGYEDKTETTATLNFADGSTSTYTATINRGNSGSRETIKEAPLWSDFENGKRVDNIDINFVQDPSDSASGSVEFLWLEVF